MAEESRSPTVDAEPEEVKSTAEESVATNLQDVAIQPEQAQEALESRTQGMLREAIQKVMEEIAFHEKEALKHRQQAEALRKDLRESFAFLQEQGGKGKPAKGPEESLSGAGNEPKAEARVESFPVANRRHQASPKKKQAGGKTKKG